jgi:AraC-like DNA-binding protein
MVNHQRQFQLITPFLKALEQLGVDSEQLFSRYQKVQGSSASKGELTGMDFVLLLEIATELSGDPCLALRLGRTIDVFSAGVFGFALMSCLTLRDTIRLTLGYQKVLSPGPNLEPMYQADGIGLRANMKRGSATQRQLVTELSISMNVAHAEFLVNGPLDGLEIELNYPEPAHADCYRECFSMPVTFGSEYTQVWMSEHFPCLPVKTAQPAGHVLYLQQCEEILRGMDEVEDTTAAVRRLLLQSAGAFLSIAEVAEELHISERTLRRRLKAEFTSFRAVLDDVKNVLAQKYLTRTALDVAEIATLLGYSEAENFHPAFARWNGMTPTEFRRQKD